VNYRQGNKDKKSETRRLIHSGTRVIRNNGIRNNRIRDNGIRNNRIRDNGIRNNRIRDNGIRDKETNKLKSKEIKI
jgi:hypothetical protein